MLSHRHSPIWINAVWGASALEGRRNWIPSGQICEFHTCAALFVYQVSAQMGQGPHPPSESLHVSHHHLRFPASSWPRVVGRVDAVYRTILHSLSFLIFTSALWYQWLSVSCRWKNLDFLTVKQDDQNFCKGHIASILGFAGCKVSVVTQLCHCSTKVEVDTE